MTNINHAIFDKDARQALAFAASFGEDDDAEGASRKSGAKAPVKNVFEKCTRRVILEEYKKPPRIMPYSLSKREMRFVLSYS